MNRCFDLGTPNISSSDRTRNKRNLAIFQTFSDKIEDNIDVNKQSKNIKISDGNQIIFSNQETQLSYIKGLYEDALKCGDDHECVFIDKEGDGYGRENHITDLYQGRFTIQDTSGVDINVDGEFTFQLNYIEPLGAYFDIGCDRIQNYLEYTTLSGEKITRDNFNFKYPLALYVEES
jgi:hypothetical protein